MGLLNKLYLYIAAIANDVWCVCVESNEWRIGFVFNFFSDDGEWI